MAEETTEERAMLHIIGGPSAGQEHELRAEGVTIGRGADADITVPDKLLSRVHARIFFGNSRWRIEDLRSTNGTWVLGERISAPVIMPTRANIRIGNTLVELVNPMDAARERALLESCVISYHFRPLTAREMS